MNPSLIARIYRTGERAVETADIIPVEGSVKLKLQSPVERYALVDDVPVRQVAPHVMGMGLAGGLGSRWRWCRMGGCNDERDNINRR